MPYVRVAPDVFLSHGGVDVFHTYREGTDEPWDYWFTTNPETADDSRGHGDGGHFDVRRLAGRWSDTPNVAEWDAYWKPRFNSENECVVALIRQAIDERRIPHIG